MFASISSAQIDNLGFITDWLLLGPIPWIERQSRLNANQLALDKEDKVLDSKMMEPIVYRNNYPKPTDGKSGTGLAKDLKWKEHKSPTKNIDLNIIFAPNNEMMVAYAYTSVNSPKDQEVQMRTGSDDAVIVWLNTLMVLNQGRYRGGADDQDITLVKLHKGWNSVLLKVVEQGGGWNFRLRFTDDNAKPIDNLRINTNFQGHAIPQGIKGASVSDDLKLTTTWGQMKKEF